VKLCEVTTAGGSMPTLSQLFGEADTNQVHAASQPDGTNAAAATVTSILTAAQFRSALKALESRAGVDILVAPRVTTLSGRQAQVKVTNVRYVVTGLESSTNWNPAGVSNAASVLSPVAEPIETGPVVDLVPHVQADGWTIQLSVVANVREFLGYDSKQGFIAAVRSGQAQTEEMPTPLPRIQNRKVTAAAAVRDGQTLVLLGGTVSEQVLTRDKVPVLGDLPMVGRLFQSSGTQQQQKHLLIFVTPTIIDPAGNRVH
jgi:general secretion pathway protein D